METNLENWQAQVDEIQALESIFEQDFQIIAVKNLSSSEKKAADADDGVAVVWNAESLAALSAAPSIPWTISCQISIHIDPPHRSSPHFPLKNNNNTKAEDEKDDPVWQFAIRCPLQCPLNIKEEEETAVNEAEIPTHGIKYLPPIILSLDLPSTYPSTTPPNLSIAAMWLSQRQAFEIEGELSKLWEASLPVIWTWTDWLQTSLMEYYLEKLNKQPTRGYYILEAGEKAPTDVGGGGGEDVEDVDSDSGGRSGSGNKDEDEHNLQLEEEEGVEGRLIVLLRYSTTREIFLFCQNLHTCSICFEDQRGSQFLRLDCRHVFCTCCIREQATIHIRDGSLDALKCPQPGCGDSLQAHTLRQILDPETYERWEMLTLQRALDQMPDAAYCPRCATLSLEDLSENVADCPRCFYIFCTLCNEGRHPGVQCVSAETRLAMLRRKAEGGGGAAIAELRKQEHEMMSLAMIEKSSKPCPSCGMAIQRSEGCNKMVCGNCNAFFCYKCGKQISGYDHYKAGGECVLFDEAEILRWERRWQEQAGAHAAAAFRNDYLLEFGGDYDQGEDEQHINRRAGRGGNRGGGGGGGAPTPNSNCPSCGQPNYRFANNNHLHCWSCRLHFCAVCRTVLQRRGGGMHFGPKGCPQHS
jgi:E3 ubiquitin-protein ligase RNF14